MSDELQPAGEGQGAELAKQFQEYQLRLEYLQAEQRDIPGASRDCVDAGDTERFWKLMDRGSEIKQEMLVVSFEGAKILIAMLPLCSPRQAAMIRAGARAQLPEVAQAVELERARLTETMEQLDRLASEVAAALAGLGRLRRRRRPGQQQEIRRNH